VTVFVPDNDGASGSLFRLVNFSTCRTTAERQKGRKSQKVNGAFADARMACQNICGPFLPVFFTLII
jgi:hypothetical protein